MKLIFVASPYAGDIKMNTEFAKEACRFVKNEGHAFFAPHLLYPFILNDDRPDERRCGMEMGLAVLARCDELWVFGSVVSDGMVTEVREAARLGIPVRYFELADGFRLEAIPPY